MFFHLNVLRRRAFCFTMAHGGRREALATVNNTGEHDGKLPITPLPILSPTNSSRTEAVISRYPMTDQRAARKQRHVTMCKQRQHQQQQHGVNATVLKSTRNVIEMTAAAALRNRRRRRRQPNNGREVWHRRRTAPRRHWVRRASRSTRLEKYTIFITRRFYIAFK